MGRSNIVRKMQSTSPVYVQLSDLHSVDINLHTERTDFQHHCYAIPCNFTPLTGSITTVKLL